MVQHAIVDCSVEAGIPKDTAGHGPHVVCRVALLLESERLVGLQA
jgi:hypothetical protein